jgi:hypothetical protein
LPAIAFSCRALLPPRCRSPEPYRGSILAKFRQLSEREWPSPLRLILHQFAPDANKINGS